MQLFQLLLCASSTNQNIICLACSKIITRVIFENVIICSVRASHPYLQRHRNASGTPASAPARTLLTSQNGIVDKKPIAQTFVHVSVTLNELALNSI